MGKQKFEDCNRFANNNLNNKGNLSEFLKGYLILAQAMGKEEIAYEAVIELPPSAAFDNPDPRVDVVVSMCEQTMINNRQNVEEFTHSMSKVA